MQSGYNASSIEWMGGLTIVGEIKTPNLIDMLVFAYVSSEHDCNYVIVTFGLPVYFLGKFARSYTK